MHHDDDRPQSVGELLDLLHPRGIYSVTLLEREFVRFGFSYDRGTDRLAYRGRAEPVASRPTDDFVREQVEQENLVMDEDKLIEEQAMDAVELSDIVFRLLFPGRAAPGRLHADRDDAYAANVAAIRAGLATEAWVALIAVRSASSRPRRASSTRSAGQSCAPQSMNQRRPPSW